MKFKRSIKLMWLLWRKSGGVVAAKRPNHSLLPLKPPLLHPHHSTFSPHHSSFHTPHLTSIIPSTPPTSLLHHLPLLECQAVEHLGSIYELALLDVVASQKVHHELLVQQVLVASLLLVHRLQLQELLHVK